VQPQASEPAQPQTAAASGASENPAPSRNLSEEEIAMLRKMGDDYISSGDFVGARTVLERAAEAGDSSAAFAIASTYDPVVLERFKVRGLEPDIVKASFWYERARALGSSEAPHRLQAMMASRSN
jgi:TPR repeat protein